MRTLDESMQVIRSYAGWAGRGLSPSFVGELIDWEWNFAHRNAKNQHQHPYGVGNLPLWSALRCHGGSGHQQMHLVRGSNFDRKRPHSPQERTRCQTIG